MTCKEYQIKHLCHQAMAARSNATPISGNGLLQELGSPAGAETLGTTPLLPSGTPLVLPFWLVTPLFSPILSPHLPPLPGAARNSSSPPALPPLTGALGGGCSALGVLEARWPETRRRPEEDGRFGMYSSRGVHPCKKLCNRPPDGRHRVGSSPWPILQPCRGLAAAVPLPAPPPAPACPSPLPPLTGSRLQGL